MTKGTLSVLTQSTGNEPLTMSSREIAELTGKQHSNVMRDIRAMMDTLEQDSNLNSVCKSTTYTASSGQSYPQYELDKDTCLTLLLGYDAIARMKVVKRWRELEAIVAQPTLPPVNLSRLQIIEMALQSEQERLVLESKVDQLKTTMTRFVQQFEEILQTEGTLASKGFQAFRETQASLASNPLSPLAANPAPQPKLSTFEFENHTIRAVTNATGETRFVGKDVCQVLGFHRHSMMISAHCRENPTYHRILTNRGIQPHRLLSETDVAALVERSHSPLASAFWTAVSPFRGIMGLGRGVTSPKLFRPETGVD